MFFDIISDLVNNTSPLYLYVGLLWSMMGAFQLINMDMNQFRKHHHFHIKRVYTFQVDTALIEKPDVKNRSFKTWLTHKKKRIEAPDDDSDDDSFSIFQQIKEIRGGLFCKNILYSLLLKNIAF